MKLASTLLMLRPRHFGYNPENADNTFARPAREVASAALAEFDAVVARLRTAGVRLLVLADASSSPDAVFPNNWFSLLPDGRLLLYPMKAPSRRTELRPQLALELQAHGSRVEAVLDLSSAAEQGRFLEGTGSLVLDHDRRLAFAALSERTDAGLLARWAELTGYRVEAAAARSLIGADGRRHPVYHSNVLLALGEGFALFCPEALAEPEAAEHWQRRLAPRELIRLTMAQLRAFAGNMLQVQSAAGPLLLMSETARAALTSAQLERLSAHTRWLSCELPTIEAVGGGSLRCMLAEAGWQ